MNFSRTRLLAEPGQADRIRKLLRAHLPPPDHISSTISALSDELSRYDDEISRLKTQLSTLTADRAALEAYHNDCSSLLSPIRRLPSELLVEIFDLCDRSFTPAFQFDDVPAVTLEIELSRLAHAPLLAVSQVCALWHDIAMGTQSLWNTIELHNILWSTRISTEKMVSLLQSALTRGGTSLLSILVVISASVSEPQTPALALLAAHSERWKSAGFMCGEADLLDLSDVKGRLPQLQSLELLGEPSPLDMFEIAPRLQRLHFSGSPADFAALPNLPLHQLHELRCTEMWGASELLGFPASPALNLSTHLSNTAKFCLQLASLVLPPNIQLSASLPPITSSMASLWIGVERDGFSAGNVTRPMGEIIKSLTLPALEEFEIDAEGYPRLALPWPQNEFLALSSRSSFHTHLLCLKLYHSIVTPEQLLECLANLPALEMLGISDHRLVAEGGGADQLLISDTLLGELTRTSKRCLIPRLKSFNCQSLLQFDDTMYLNFVLSRLPTARADDENSEKDPFEIGIWWLPGYNRELDPAVIERLDELRLQNQVDFLFEAGEGDDEVLKRTDDVVDS
ncbi:hypothetical protein B0H11DRAFT_2297560 [Mycena galericulata]|nr:hypothetical protein B0H11DRAFT_2297560 [Mycena galericulata]